MAQTERLAQLRQNLIEFFSDEELRTLCFDLGVDYDNLPGRAKADKARELLSDLDHRGRIPELIKLCSTLRPNVAWQEILTAIQAEPPFKGLQYFDEADADLFFGRELLTARLIGRLRQERFLAVVGASGSGKSSVVRAGLVPTLKRGEPLANGTLPPDGSDSWQRLLITPTADPLEKLALVLTRDLLTVSEAQSIQNELASNATSLHLHVCKYLDRQSGSHMLLIVDQFEELFTACKDDAKRRAFIDNLLHAAMKPDGSTIVVIALRADFYAHCALYANLREALEKHQAYIGPMTAEELRRAMEEPARRNGWEFEPGLVDLLLRDVGADRPDQAEPGALPLLSHALLETWKRQRGRTLTLEGYHESGEVRGAIAKTADGVFNQLPPEQQQIARNIFLRLTELGEGTQDTRRRAALSELVPRPEEKLAVEAVLKELADKRLITTSEDTAEVAHEALIREWPALRQWLDEDREGLRLCRQLTQDGQEWLGLNRDEGALYRGARLAQVAEWAQNHTGDLNALDREFLDASQELAKREETEREAQRQRELEAAQKLAEAEKRRAEEQTRSANRLSARNRIITGIGAAALLAAIVAIFFGFQSNQNLIQANRNEAAAQAASTQAVAQTRVATSRQWAAVANSATDSERSLLLALHAVWVTFSIDKTAMPEALDALHRALQASRLELVLAGHTDVVSSVAFNPDGQSVATGSADGTAKVWNASSGQVLLTISGQGGQILGVAFSPDGKWLATASDDRTARIWDAFSGRELQTLSGHTDAIWSVAFSPDGRLAATGSGDKTARVWDTSSGQELLTLSGHTDKVLSVAFTFDGKWLLTASEDGTARVWDVASGRELMKLAGHTDEVRSIVSSPDGMRLATASRDGTVKVWDAYTGRELLTVSGRSHGYVYEMYRVAFTPDGKRLVTASADKTATVWDASSGQELLSLRGHSDWVWDLAISPDGKRLATASRDQTARVWDISAGQELLTLVGHTAEVRGVVFSPDGQRLATASDDRTVKVWDVSSGQTVLTLPGHTDAVWNVAFSPNGTRLASASFDRTAKVWDAATGHELLTLSGHANRVLGVAFSPDSALVATASADATTKLWDVSSGQLLRTLSGHSAEVQSVAFSPDGKLLVTASNDKTVRIWQVSSGQELRILSGHGNAVTCVAFSPDGKRLATASDDYTAKVWDVASGKMLYDLSSHTNAVHGVALSPDGMYLATASLDATTKVWEAESGRELFSLAGHTDGIWGVTYSPDGTRLATASADKTVRLYAMRIQELMALALKRATRPLTTEECQKYLRVESCPPLPKIESLNQ